MVKVCQYCGEEYYEVKNIPLYIPETIREIMRFQPRCSCLKIILVINFGLYLNKIKREWAEAENDILNSIKLCDLLIIDDFGSERNTEFAIEKAFLLIDTRYRSEKPMIITSNLNLFQLEEKFTAKIRSRIEEMCYLIKVNSKDKRKDANSMFFKYIA